MADSGREGRKRGRLSRSGDFDRAYRDGRSHANRFIVLYAFPRSAEESGEDVRLGVSVGKKVGGAVDRNKVKRTLREAFWELSRPAPGAARLRPRRPLRDRRPGRARGHRRRPRLDRLAARRGEGSAELMCAGVSRETVEHGHEHRDAIAGDVPKPPFHVKRRPQPPPHAATRSPAPSSSCCCCRCASTGATSRPRCPRAAAITRAARPTRSRPYGSSGPSKALFLRSGGSCAVTR